MTGLLLANGSVSCKKQPRYGDQLSPSLTYVRDRQPAGISDSQHLGCSPWAVHGWLKAVASQGFRLPELQSNVVLLCFFVISLASHLFLQAHCVLHWYSATLLLVRCPEGARPKKLWLWP